jgi:predicted nucleotidyltransferase
VDLGDPTRAISPTLDGTVLAVLAAAGRPMTVSDVAAQTVRGSEIGVRRTLGRLVDQGIVQATEVGRVRVHELNRAHVAAPAAELLAGLRLEVWKRLRETLFKWKVHPVYACAFGSAARGDANADSDIDVLLVHPPFPGERWPAKSVSLVETLGILAVDFARPVTTEADARRWNSQIETLHGLVRSWTGNSLQVVDLSAFDWVRQRRSSTPLWQAIERDAVELYRPSATVAIASRTSRDA